MRNTQTLCCLCNNSVNLELHHTLMVDTCHHTVFKTHRMYNRVCPNVIARLVRNSALTLTFHCDKCATPMWDFNHMEHWLGVRGLEELSVLCTNFFFFFGKPKTVSKKFC